MTAQRAEPEAKPSRYSPGTQRLITRARVTRDLLIAAIGVVFVVLGFTVATPSYALSEPVGVFGIAMAVVFLVAAIFRAASNDFDRTWSRGSPLDQQRVRLRRHGAVAGWHDDQRNN